MPIDAAQLTADLIRCPSVTPIEGGALDLLEQVLTDLGFTCTRLPFSEPGTEDVDNLYARLGTSSPNLCFAGHTDVVPVGAEAAWTADPFGAEVKDGILYGRGAVDMKGGIACWVAAVSRFLEENGTEFDGSLSLMITGDEEAVSINGTKKMVAWVKETGEVIDQCIVGEPTNPEQLGTMIKIGRRGSLNGYLTVRGTQGHVAYPHRADNPTPRLLTLLSTLEALHLDDGNEHFQPSNLEITDIGIGNEAHNIIPAEARARFNIRFSSEWSAATLEAHLRDALDKAAGNSAYELVTPSSGESFYTPPGPLSDTLSAAIEEVTGLNPELSTSGGTSDARFIKDICPVAEFGLIGQTMHQVDECVALEDLTGLTDIYAAVLKRVFAPAS